jgi:uncharacterized membrane protein
MNHYLIALTVAAALGSGLIAGAFFAFSTFVMPALDRTTAPHGAEAMQHINVTVLNGWFLGTFMGTAVLSGLIAALSLWHFQPRPGALALAASALYLLGTFGVTIGFNVPMNDRLANHAPTAQATSEYWPHYLARWTIWNTARTLAATFA